jgi:hypothetical protein
MERFKQTITKLEDDICELKKFQTKIQGSMPSRGDMHYCTSTQEFGEYDLDEIDTFRFIVTAQAMIPNHPDPIYRYNTYRYRLVNTLPAIGNFDTGLINIDIENIEKFSMKAAMSEEKRKCLQSKLWNFAVDYTHGFYNAETHKRYPELYKDISDDFYTDITIPFTHKYKISPHVSFYITPLLNSLDECVIHEITTKQVVFRIKYGNIIYKGQKNSKYMPHIYSGLKLHYSISGVVIQNDNLLD